MKTLYLDIFSGLSGDMFLGAMVDLGVEPAQLEEGLSRLPLSGYHLHFSRQQKGAIAGIKVDVHVEAHRDSAGGLGHEPAHEEEPHGHSHHEVHTHDHDHHHDHHHGHGHSHLHPHSHLPDASHGHAHDESRDFHEIKALIEASSLSTWVKAKSLAVFQRVAEAEGKVHGMPADQVHFHEVGAVDSIVDIVGACVALELLGRPRVLAGPVVDGTGWIHCAHGRFPLPAPATLEILGARSVSITQCAEPHELLTPTGAALLAEFAEGFGPMHHLRPMQVGYGLGTRELDSRPNVLRAILAESQEPAGAQPHDWESDTVAVLETNLDDVNPEILGHFVEHALAAGALDVFHTPIQMKKNRPGVLLSVLCEAAQADQFTEQILCETSAFGVRRVLAERRKLRREFQAVATPYGEVTVKIGRLDGRVVQAAPEYESARRVATAAKVTLKEVYAAAQRAISQAADRSGRA